MLPSQVNVEPTEGKLALWFIEEDHVQKWEEQAEKDYSEQQQKAEAEYALVVGVGPGVKGYRKGSVVVVSHYTKHNSPCIGEIYLVDAKRIDATLSA